MDLGLIGLMRCSSSSARSGTAGQSRTKAQRPAAGHYGSERRRREFVGSFGNLQVMPKSHIQGVEII